MERQGEPRSSGIGGLERLRIATARTVDLRPHEREAIVELCTWAHGVDFGELFALLPPDGLHVIAHLDAKTVGHAVITTRWLQPDGLPFLRCAYVDAVATAPNQQLRGIGHAVMRRLAEAAEADQYEIGGLESELRGFYEPLGWERWRGDRAAQTDVGPVATPDELGVFVLRMARTPPLDLDGSLTVKADGRFW
jgi:GNAT superfamily N-acetyltransferase